ncbi:WXG100 family type VII secretion target [Paenibacillus polysaccharolyticus]|uniref:WXG100 family type VII secretion target n=1 Tax=Paenibacillus polysaccharolyticus TaxID=582692 RepID=UPI00203DA494|nr:WXG100 family type VII secretion target [Paenibacillus polysaccharolyticus]MCM3134069.1 WXG100 family type VII secretion target [Paenibacillus polysaccharolyticus]
MLRIQVHPDELDAKARYVQQCKLDLDRMVRELDKSLNKLQSEWSGVTQEKFFWDFMEVKHVFPSTLGMLDNIQKEFTFIANNFRTTDSTGEVALYIPNELKPSFFTGAVDKAIGDTVTGLGETAEALIYNPLSTLGSLAYAMTIGKVVDAGRGLAFAWDAAWGNGTARSDIKQFVDEKKKQLDEDESGYVKGAMVGQALSYFIFGRALHSKERHESGGGGGGKKGTEQGNVKEEKGKSSFITNPAEMKKHIISPEDGFQAFLERKYIDIRKSGIEDISTVAKNTGLADEQVLNMKKHLFLDTKDLSVGGKPYENLYFQADPDVAHAWQLAQKGELNDKQKAWFRELANHELKEKELMDGGMPLRDPSTWNGKGFDIQPEKNAHDKANLTDKQPTRDFPGYDKYKEYEENIDKDLDY